MTTPLMLLGKPISTEITSPVPELPTTRWTRRSRTGRSPDPPGFVVPYTCSQTMSPLPVAIARRYTRLLVARVYTQPSAYTEEPSALTACKSQSSFLVMIGSLAIQSLNASELTNSALCELERRRRRRCCYRRSTHCISSRSARRSAEASVCTATAAMSRTNKVRFFIIVIIIVTFVRKTQERYSRQHTC
eukprot:TRINITY_DN68203_c8_g1_i2.p1 TRINITY_DN68203_c8_g1~~TRINITY_DN68203_c8_g1_i2.p1  ORF type:complete len:190 (+),score=24.53 TRINITY_DN68203_c8_g1_i2:599-1168(+)